MEMSSIVNANKGPCYWFICRVNDYILKMIAIADALPFIPLTIYPLTWDTLVALLLKSPAGAFLEILFPVFGCAALMA